MARTRPFDSYPDKYDAWFLRHRDLYLTEIEAVRRLLPQQGTAVEIGVGSGKFAMPLGIRFGVEPSQKMALRAIQAGILVAGGVAEALPLKTSSVDTTLMVTTICFVDDPVISMKEARRILRPGGRILIGLVDRDSHLGRRYLARKEESVFYREATFYSSREVLSVLKEAGFCGFQAVQTILPDDPTCTRIEEGFGRGGFVVIRAESPL